MHSLPYCEGQAIEEPANGVGEIAGGHRSPGRGGKDVMLRVNPEVAKL